MFLIAYVLIAIASIFGNILLVAFINRLFDKVSRTRLMMIIKAHSLIDRFLLRRRHVIFPLHHDIKKELEVIKEGKVPLMIYRLESGKAIVLYADKKIGELKPKDIFGSYELKKNKPSHYKVILQQGAKIDAVGKSLLHLNRQGENNGKANKSINR